MGKQTDVALVNLDKIDVEKLPELANFKERGLALVKEYPLVVIEDNPTYEVAKKNRTALKTFRTDVQKQEKVIKDKLNSFKNRVSKVSSELIDITLKQENEQQEEINRWEEIKEKEKEAKRLAEENRKKDILAKVGGFYNKFAEKIQSCSFEQIDSLEAEFVSECANFDVASLDEFDFLFEEKQEVLVGLWEGKKQELKEAEEKRLAELEEKRVQEIKSSIDNFFSSWTSRIYKEVELESTEKLMKEFTEEKALNCQEFQSLYAEKRALLIDMFQDKISVIKNQIAQEKEAERLKKEKEELLQAKKELMVEKRINFVQSVSLGQEIPSFILVFVENDTEEEFEQRKTEIKNYFQLEDLKSKEVVEPEVIEMENIIEEETEIIDVFENTTQEEGEVVSQKYIAPKAIILDRIKKTVDNFTYFDRLEDSVLSAADLRESILSKEISVDEIISTFETQLRDKFQGL